MSTSISAEQWAERKDEILRLYIEEGLALKPVMRAMRDSNFNPTESQYRTKLKKWGLRKPRNHRKQPMIKTDFSVLVGAPTPAIQALSGHSSAMDHDSTPAPGPSGDMLPSSPAHSSHTWQAQFHQNSSPPEAMGVAIQPAAQTTSYHHLDVNNQAHEFSIDGTSDGVTFANLQRDSKTIIGMSTGDGLSSYHDALLPESLQSPKYPQAVLQSSGPSLPNPTTCSPDILTSLHPWRPMLPMTTDRPEAPLAEMGSQALWWQEESSDPYVSQSDILPANPYEAALLY